MLRQTIKEVKWRCIQVSFEKFLEMFTVWLRPNIVWQIVPVSRAGMTDGSVTKLGFQKVFNVTLVVVVTVLVKVSVKLLKISTNTRTNSRTESSSTSRRNSWLPVQEVTGRPDARPRRRCCSESNHLGHVGRSLVGVNEVHLLVTQSRLLIY